MVTSYPQSIAPNQSISGESHDDGRAARVWDRVRQAMCGLHGHDRLVHFEEDRMFLRCVSCGHETPGWEIKATQGIAAPRSESLPRRLPQFIGERKIA